MVFLVGMEEGAASHALDRRTGPCWRRSAASPMWGSPACERLYLTNALSRTLYGATQYNPPSRFLGEIPEELLEEAEGSSTRGSRRPGTSGSWSWGAPRASPGGRRARSGRHPAAPLDPVSGSHGESARARVRGRRPAARLRLRASTT